MARSVKEWVGKTDDSSAPPTVRQRVKDRDSGMCRLCGTAIKDVESFDLDHIVALINGGENRETNLSAVHRHCHLQKTKADVAEKSKVGAMRRKFTGAEEAASKMRSAPFGQSKKAARREQHAEHLSRLPPKPLFVSREDAP